VNDTFETGMELYLRPTLTINADHEGIVTTVNEVTAGCTTDAETATALFYFVRDSIRYNIYMISAAIDDFRASQVLEWGKGYCVQKAVLLAAMGRAAGVPSRLTFARIRNNKLPPHIVERIGTNILPRHGYTQFFLHDRWVSATPTFDKELCSRLEVPPVEFNGEGNAVLPEKDLRGNPFIDYVEKFPHCDDLPFEWIAERVRAVFGPEKRAWVDKNQEQEK